MVGERSWPPYVPVPMAILLPLLIPLFLVVTAVYGFVKVLQTRALVNAYPQLDKPQRNFRDLIRRELKNLARERDDLRRVLKFAKARTTFRVAALLPPALIALIVLLFAVVA